MKQIISGARVIVRKQRTAEDSSWLHSGMPSVISKGQKTRGHSLRPSTKAEGDELHMWSAGTLHALWLAIGWWSFHRRTWFAPNIEVRLFNPLRFANRRSAIWSISFARTGGPTTSPSPQIISQDYRRSQYRRRNWKSSFRGDSMRNESCPQHRLRELSRILHRPE